MFLCTERQPQVMNLLKQSLVHKHLITSYWAVIKNKRLPWNTSFWMSSLRLSWHWFCFDTHNLIAMHCGKHRTRVSVHMHTEVVFKIKTRDSWHTLHFRLTTYYVLPKVVRKPRVGGFKKTANGIVCVRVCLPAREGFRWWRLSHGESEGVEGGGKKTA